MTLITITKTSQGYSVIVSDRIAEINNEKPKANPKIIDTYLAKLKKELIS